MPIKKERKPRGFKAWHKKFKADFRKEKRAKIDALLKATTLEQRQQFIRLMHEGKTLGEARQQVNICFDTALAIYKKNTKVRRFSYLQQPEDVK